MIDGTEPATRLPIIVFINNIKTNPCVLPVPVPEGAFSSTVSDCPELNISGININNAITATIMEMIIPVIVVICPAAIIVCVLVSSPFFLLNESIKNTILRRNKTFPTYSHQVLLNFAEDIKMIIGIQNSIADKIPYIRYEDRYSFLNIVFGIYFHRVIKYLKFVKKSFHKFKGEVKAIDALLTAINPYFWKTDVE